MKKRDILTRSFASRFLLRFAESPKMAERSKEKSAKRSFASKMKKKEIF